MKTTRFEVLSEAEVERIHAALQVASFLEAHSKVMRVIYPGLESHPHRALAQRQMSGFGGMLTFQLKGGLSAAINLAEKIRLFSYATSLGHAHSLLFYYPPTCMWMPRPT